MRKNYKEIKEYKDPLYALTANRLISSLGPLQETVNCDVCIIGGGFTGLSAAYELSGKGMSVVIVEKGTIASSASGRNGGQILRGFAKSPDEMIQKFGLADAKFMNNVTLEGLALILDRIKKHQIDCDLKFGHITAAIKKRHLTSLKQEIAEWKKIGHSDLQILDKKATQDIIKSNQYIGGMFDPKGAHFHPTNYALGLAEAAQYQGVRIHDSTEAIEVVHNAQPRVVTKEGLVNAKYVVIAGDIHIKGFEKETKKTIAATAHMIATEPLGERRAKNMLTKTVSVADANFVMNYFRLSGDHRLLFGGNCNYSNIDYAKEDERLRARMLKVFPQLKTTLIEHCWSGPLYFTINRMPSVGRITPHIYYAHGFGGQGIITSNIIGKIMAEAVAGHASRFDAFAKIKHAPFAGGDLLKRPLFVLGMTWYQLRDLL